MPTYEITSPDGRTFEVTAPEGASKDDVLRYAQSQFQGQGQTRSKNLLDTFDAIDKQQTAAPQQQAPETGRLAPNVDYGKAGDEAGRALLRMALPPVAAVADLATMNPQAANYVGQQLKKGVAAGLGMPVDAVTNLLNLGIAGYGIGKNKLTGSTDLPALITNPFGGAGTFERLFQTNNEVQPTSEGNRIAGRFVRDLGAASIPIAGMAGTPAAFLGRNPSLPALLQAQTQSPVAPIVAGLGLQAAASGAGELARAAVPEPYKEVADLTGQILSIPATAYATGGGIIGRSAGLAKKEASQENINRLAAGYVENKLRQDVKNFPGAKEKLQEALALSDEIPGFQARIGQASGVPSLIDMERRVATSGPEQFNKRAITDEANRLAIQRQAEQELPLLTGKHDIPQRLQTTQTERQTLAEGLPEVAPDETGQTLRAARASKKGRFDQIAAQKFNAPVEKANELGVKINPTPIFDKIEQIQKNPILQYDATNAPAVVQRMKQVIGREMPDQEAPQLYGADNQPLYAPRDRIFNIGFEDLKAMREAVNQDIAREAGSGNPNARQRLRSLLEIRDTIDESATQAPKAVTDLWNSAREFYAKEYAPSFLKGINLKQSLRDITGEYRIPDEKLASQYFRPMGTTQARNFNKLYGDVPQAQHAMENHVLDLYRKEVVKDGVIDPKRHDAFLQRYKDPLKEFPSLRENLDSMGNAARLLGAREEQLTQANSLLEKAQLDRLKYDDHGTLGLDPAKVDAFLAKHGQALRDAIASVEGPKVADEHMANLQKFAKAAAIADRGRLSGSAYPDQSTNPLEIKSKVGFTGRTIFSMWRAVETGRTSAEDVAYTLGAQGVSHRLRMALIAAEEKAVQDPETARLIAQTINQPANSPAGKRTLLELLQKGGLYLVGADNLGRVSRYRVAPFAIEATKEGRKAAQ